MPRVPTTTTAQARAWAEPRLGRARDRMAHDIKPRVSEAWVSARVASEPFRHEARFRTAATIAALRGQVEPRHEQRPHRRRGRLAMAGAAGAAAAWTAWARARNRTGAHERPFTATGSADAAGASPDEVVADVTEPEAPRHRP